MQTQASTPMVFVTLGLNLACGMFDYKRTLKSGDSAMSSVYTQDGASKLLKHQLKQNIKGLEGKLRLADLKLNVNVSFPVDMFITKLTVENITFNEDTKVEFKNNEIVASVISNAKFSFAWKLQENMYPYITDSGVAYMNGTNISFKGLFRGKLEQADCPGHLNADFVPEASNTSSVEIKLIGGTSWIFKALYHILADQLSQQLQKQLAMLLEKAVSTTFKNNLYQASYSANFTDPYYYTFKDERFTSGLVVKNNLLILKKSGYVYNRQDIQDEVVNASLLMPIEVAAQKKDVQHVIQQAAFNNLFYILHKYEKAFNQNTIITLSAPTVEIANGSVFMKINVSSVGKNYLIELEGQPGWKQEMKYKIRYTTLFFQFQARKVEHIMNDPLKVDQVMEEVISMVNKVMQEGGYQLNYLPQLQDGELVVDSNVKAVKFMANIAKQ